MQQLHNFALAKLKLRLKLNFITGHERTFAVVDLLVKPLVCVVWYETFPNFNYSFRYGSIANVARHPFWPLGASIFFLCSDINCSFNARSFPSL